MAPECCHTVLVAIAGCTFCLLRGSMSAFYRMLSRMSSLTFNG